MTRIHRPGVRRGYDLWAPDYDSTRNPIVWLDRRHALPALRAQAGEDVLDAGCGTGAHLKTLQAQQVRAVGIDFSCGMLRRAAATMAAPRLVVGDLHAPLPFCDRAFDAVLCSLVSEHLRELRGFFREVFRVLRPGGRFVFSAFHPDLARAGIEANFERDGIEYRLGAASHSEEDFSAALDAAGFGAVEARTFHADERLVRDVPQARRHLGRAMLLLLTPHRPSLAPGSR